MQKKKVQSAKDILLGHNFLEQRQKTEKYIHHEFQDYAYRLANQLGDLSHKNLYMKLARSVPRHIMEQALAFTGDYKEANKGRLFMWKLKQIRLEQQLLLDNENFDYEFVLRRMGSLQDLLAEDIYQKYRKNDDSEFDATTLTKFLQELEKLPPVSKRRKLKILVLDSMGGKIEDLIRSMGFGVETLEISRKLVHMIKKNNKDSKIKHQLYKTDRYSKSDFDAIWVDKFWRMVSLDTEREIVNSFLDVVAPNGLIFLSWRNATPRSQSWQQITVDGKVNYAFHKESAASETISYFADHEIVLEKEDSCIVRKLVR